MAFDGRTIGFLKLRLSAIIIIIIIILLLLLLVILLYNLKYFSIVQFL